MSTTTESPTFHSLHRRTAVINGIDVFYRWASLIESFLSRTIGTAGVGAA